MFTQCPNCETTFQVNADQLKAASGDVRCGECLSVFNALENLSEDLGSGSESPGTNNQAPEINPNTMGDASTSIDKNLEEFFGDLFEDSPDETFNEPITYANPNTSTKEKSKPDGGFFYGANEATIEKILEEELKPEVSELDPELDNDSELLEPPVETVDELDTDKYPLNIDDDILQSHTDIDLVNTDSGDINSDDPDSEDEADKMPVTDVPSVILDELQAAKAQHLKPPSTQWVVGSIALMLIFVLQAVYFSRDTLAKNPSYRPLLTNACEVLGCEINIVFDTRLIEIIGRDVRSHPSSKKALIAGTTLINNASYAQPYPLLTLTFSDMTGTKLAQRRFTPREYLRGGTDIAAGMPPQTPIEVELHLVDPGKAAVNFEFTPEIDPRS